MKLIEAYLTINEFSRTGHVLREHKGLVMHYLGKDHQTALLCRDYFESLKTQDSADNVPDRSASAHDIIDHNGDVYLVVPPNEKAYHCGSSKVDPSSGEIYTDLARAVCGDYAKYPAKTSPNSCLIGIEMCHGENGVFTDLTVHSAITRAAHYCIEYCFDPMTRIFTHEQIVGWKQCPLYWSKHPRLFEAFKEDVSRLVASILMEKSKCM